MSTLNRLLLSLVVLAVLPLVVNAQTVWLDETDLSKMETGWGTAQSRKSVDGKTLTIAGQTFERGVGTHAVSTLLLKLDGAGKTFTASVGLDDEANEKASVQFFVIGDRKVLFSSDVMKKGTPAKNLTVNVGGIKLLGLLVGDAGDGIDWDHADWCDAKLTLTKALPAKSLVIPSTAVSSEPYILTPKSPEKPRINGARVFGVRPGNPFLYTVAASGKRPMTFSAEGLPAGLTIDDKTGRITGTVNDRGEYRVRLTAGNSLGKDDRELRIVVGENICLTPPLGWNSWNCWACAVDDAKVRSSADAMVSSGLVDHGWTYINIDDCWEIKTDAKEESLLGEPRDKDGMINTNKRFPDMKSLSEYVHSKGLKLGIYSSPGPKTCAGFTATYKYEDKDAQRWGDWGIDYVKYDWCSYGDIAKDQSLPELKKPYFVMRAALDKVKRDIVYSLCQYGMGNVWEWGAEVGGNCWRTTGDIGDSWGSMSEIGFNQNGHEKFAGPGHWNDPDMLVVGLVGWGPELHPSRLAPDEQYTHISLWSLLSSPLLIGCDLARLDPFTLNLLTNDEVLAISQDPLGKPAGRISNENGKQIWARDLEGGSKAVGLFYADTKKNTPADYFSWGKKGSGTIVLKAGSLGITGKFKVRDVWRQKDLGVFSGKFEAKVPYHGVLLVKITEVK